VRQRQYSEVTPVLPNIVDLYPETPGFVCPVEFWPASGYRGHARYVGLWWDATTDEACWSDGRTTYIGAEPTAYRLLLERNFPPGHPAHWLLGAGGTAAAMWLVVERPAGRAWLVTAGDAADILAAQYLDDQDAAADWFPEFADGRVSDEVVITGAWREPALPALVIVEEMEEWTEHDQLKAALAMTRDRTARGEQP